MRFIHSLSWIHWTVVSLIIGLVVAQITIAFMISSIGKELTQYEQEYARLSYSNQQLKEDIAEDQSLVLIAQKSQELGLIRPETILYLTPVQEQAHVGSVNTVQ